MPALAAAPVFLFSRNPGTSIIVQSEDGSFFG